MVLSEELLTDNRFVQLSNHRQTEIIAKHCMTVEEHIQQASSRFEAERIAIDECLLFEQECPSLLVRNALRRRVEELIHQHWNSKKEL